MIAEYFEERRFGVIHGIFLSGTVAVELYLFIVQKMTGKSQIVL